MILQVETFWNDENETETRVVTTQPFVAWRCIKSILNDHIHEVYHIIVTEWGANGIPTSKYIVACKTMRSRLYEGKTNSRILKGIERCLGDKS